MMKMPYELIVSKIKEKSGISEADISRRVDEKLRQLSGLVSREGAAHIIANELGIKLFDAVTGRLQIKNILSGMRNVETAGRVMQIFEAKEFQTKDGRQGKVGSFVLGDETGTTRVVLWGEQSETLGKIKADDIVQVKGAYVKERNNGIEIHINERSEISINPEGLSVGEVKQAGAERKRLNAISEQDDLVEVVGTIVQVFEPRFFEVCPECNRRARPEGEQFMCSEHGKVNPAYSYVMNIFFDDSTDNVRVVFFRNQALRLLNKEHEAFMNFKDNPADFEQVKTDLLGETIKVVAKVRKNEMFERLELIAQRVEKANPEEELAKLEAK